ncbi:unnamed protein product [Brassica napus]|uniref:(rape) hypothetical protein n=1 Tax=Brassica napus TaxID=3708 RepID=A0A816PY95_BRANA|nr:unnamed protein product [Brassica napus]
MSNYSLLSLHSSSFFFNWHCLFIFVVGGVAWLTPFSFLDKLSGRYFFILIFILGVLVGEDISLCDFRGGGRGGYFQIKHWYKFPKFFKKYLWKRVSKFVYIFFFVKILTKLILASKILGTLSAPVLDPENLLYVRFLYFEFIVLDFVCTVPV